MEPLMVLALVAVVVVAGWFVREPCEGCGRRGTVRWLKQRKDGKPDLRFKENHRFCAACPWRER